MITWNCLGDSITDDIYVPCHYYSYIQARNPQLKVRNYGVSGSRIGGRSACGRDDVFCRRYQEMEPADIITVWGGVNDWGQNQPTPIGTFDDRTEDTFYGALHILCKGLQDKFPMSFILFATPIGSEGYFASSAKENTLQLTVEVYADAMLEVCEYYKIPVLDLCRTCGFTPYNLAQNKLFFLDGLHLNVRAHERIGVLFEACIKKHCSLLTSKKMVDLFLFMGQSNMAGRGVVNEQWDEEAERIIEGAGYEYRAVTDRARLHSMKEPFGAQENVAGRIDDGERKTGSMVTAFSNACYKKTGVPIVGVSASEGGTSILEWKPGTARFEDAVERYVRAVMYLESQGYCIRNKYMLWCQGETDGDRETLPEEYEKAFHAMVEAWINYGIDQCFVVNIGQYNGPEHDYTLIHQTIADVTEKEPMATMVSDAYWTLRDQHMMKDSYHYVQAGYNLVGKDAGAAVGEWIRNIHSQAGMKECIVER